MEEQEIKKAPVGWALFEENLKNIFFGKNSKRRNSFFALNLDSFVVLLALIAALWITYSNHFHNDFEFDDEHCIKTNDYIKDIHNIPRFFTDATTTSSLPANQAYRPGLTALNAIDYWLGGKEQPDPYYFHRSIFISYVLLGILLFFFVLKLFNEAKPHPWNKFIALFATGFFWLHTANAETINYIIARSDSFSTLMILLSFVVYQYKPGWRKFYIYLIPMALGFFVKEPSVMFIPILFFLILFYEKNISLPGIFTQNGFISSLRIILKLLPGLLIAVILILYSRSKTPPTWTSGGGDWFQYLITQPFVIVHYFNNFILPMNLSADTDWTLVPGIFDDRVLVGTGFILLMLWLAFYTSKKRETSPVAFGILWFFIALIPTSSIFSFSEVLNDHRTFFPYIGLVISASWGIALLLQKYRERIRDNSLLRTGIIALLCFFLAAHAMGTHHRNEVWNNGESLWKDVSIKSPNNARGLMNYGNAMMAKGNFTEALDLYTRAQKIWPYYSYVYINLGVLKFTMGLRENDASRHKALLDEAEANYKKALELNPQNPECYVYYGQYLLVMQRIDDAKKTVAQGLQLSPQHHGLLELKKQLDSTPVVKMPDTSALDQAIIKAGNQPSYENYLALSLAYYNANDFAMSIKAANEALKLKPASDEPWNYICSGHIALKQWDEAMDAAQKGLALNKNNVLLQSNYQFAKSQKQSAASEVQVALDQVQKNATPENYINLCMAYYHVKDYKKMADACKSAIKLNPGYAIAWNNLCSAYNSLHDWDNAIAAGKKALEIDPNYELAKNNLAEALKGKQQSQK